MEVGDKVTMTACSATFPSARLNYKAPKGRQFAFILMGVEDIGGEPIDPNEWLESRGWVSMEPPQ